MAIDGATLILAMIETAWSSEVGFGIGLVKMGTDVACPEQMVVGMKPVAGDFVSARTWTVPDGPMLVMTLA
jgi:hypothetical protein